MDAVVAGEVELAERIRQHRVWFAPEFDLVNVHLGPTTLSTRDARDAAVAAAGPDAVTAIDPLAADLPPTLASALYLSQVVASMDVGLPPEAFVVQGRYHDVVGESLRSRGFGGLAVMGARLLAGGAALAELLDPEGVFGYCLLNGLGVDGSDAGAPHPATAHTASWSSPSTSSSLPSKTLSSRL
jgi:hypothetical protein